ncbi:MAG: hypothetical protein AB7P21_20590 [Lautropia sp.]
MKPGLIKSLSRYACVALAVVLSGLQPAAAQPRPLPPGTVQVQRVAIPDPGGFDRPMIAASILLPVGWRAEGGVVWDPRNLCSGGYAFRWQAVSPDGASKVALVPAEGWTTNSFGATGGRCPNWPFTNLRAYLEALVAKLDQRARVLDFRPREDLRRQFAALESSSPLPSGELRSWVEAGEVLVAYTENGREMRGTIASVAYFSYSRFDGSWGNAPLETLSGATFPGFAASAPAGMLDMQLTEAIRASAKLDPEWSRRINAHRAAMNRDNLETARKIGQIRANTNAEIRDIQNKSWERRMKSQDRMHREYSETLREVETYRDPDAAGGTIELSNHYANAWRLQDGTYLLSNDPSLNPYAATGQDARRLEAMR